MGPKLINRLVRNAAGVHPLARNWTFLRLLAGRLVTNAGDSIYYVAALWLVHDLGNSTVYTGIASFLILLPSTLQFVVGPLVDRLQVRTSLVVTQAGQALLIGTIPLAAFYDLLSVELVLVVIPLASLLNQVTYPAQSSALPRAVEDEHLSTANSVFNAAHEGVNMTFNAVGGLLVGMAAVGAVGALVIDIGTFALAIVLFAGLTLPARTRREDAPDRAASEAGESSAAPNSLRAQIRAETRSYVAEFRDGISYLRGTAFLGVILPQIVISFAMGMLLAVLPAYAALRGGSGLYGILLSGLAAGALVGSAAWIGAAIAQWTPLIVGCFAVAIAYPGGNRVLFDTLVQTVAPEDLIGRVSSSMATLTNVATPFGSLAGGVVAAAVGPVAILWIAAAANLLVMLYFLARSSIRALPPVASVERRDERIENF